jgi:excisionase family DNA binding protein
MPLPQAARACPFEAAYEGLRLFNSEPVMRRFQMNMKGKGATKTQLNPLPARLMTVRDLSEYLHVHTSTIYRMLRQREIPAFRIGSDWRFNMESVDRWCSEQGEHKQ